MSFSAIEKRRRNTWTTVKCVASASTSAPSTRNKISPATQLPSLTNLGWRRNNRSVSVPDRNEKGRNSLLDSLTGLITNRPSKYGASKSPRSLRGAYSQDALDVGPKRASSERLWKLSLAVTKAKRRLSLTDVKPEDYKYKNPILRKRSMKGLWTIATMKNSDSEKRKIIRELKLKAKQHKVRQVHR